MSLNHQSKSKHEDRSKQSRNIVKNGQNRNNTNSHFHMEILSTRLYAFPNEADELKSMKSWSRSKHEDLSKTNRNTAESIKSSDMACHCKNFLSNERISA